MSIPQMPFIFCVTLIVKPADQMQLCVVTYQTKNSAPMYTYKDDKPSDVCVILRLLFQKRQALIK